MAERLGPIKFVPVREKVTHKLRLAIFNGDFKEGEELTLDYIASVLGVSITPIREALQILERDGLIEFKKNKRAVVLGITDKYIIDHYGLRIILESEACRLACEIADSFDGLIAIHNIAKSELEKEIYTNYDKYNYRFHHEIWKFTGNEKIINLLQDLWNSLSIKFAIDVKEYAKRSIKEHEQILDALINRNSKKAKKLMEEHLERSKNEVLENY